MSWRFVAAMALLSVLGCSRAEPTSEPAASAEANKRSVVKVAPELIASGRVVLGKVEQHSPEEEVRATGYVEADLDGAADVGALVLSTVRALHVREGDLVKKGQLLAELTAPDAARAAGELSRAKAQLGRAERALSREQRLIDRQATTQGELDRAAAEVQTLRSEERAARLLLSAYGAQGAKLSVRAPIAGVVTHRGAELGARLEAGDKLFRVVNPESFLVRAEVLERDAYRVLAGARASLAFPGRKTCDGVVKSRSAEVEPGRRTVSVLITPQKCELPIAGQTLDVRIHGQVEKAEKKLVVPRDALVDLDGSPAVFVAGASPGEFEVVPVVVELRTHAWAYLTQGPKLGTQVAVNGAILLKGEWMRASLE
ncbi:MAG: efflux RND transporter periplasmic adaptor subunit [Polyangiaceae bacterium]